MIQAVPLKDRVTSLLKSGLACLVKGCLFTIILNIREVCWHMSIYTPPPSLPVLIEVGVECPRYDSLILYVSRSYTAERHVFDTEVIFKRNWDCSFT